MHSRLRPGSPASYSSIHCEICERNCVISATAFSVTSAMSMLTAFCAAAGCAGFLSAYTNMYKPKRGGL